MIITFDTHMHSLFSHDGKYSMQEMAKTAQGMGLKYICFTEHFDADNSHSSYKRYNYAAYKSEVARVNDLFCGKITVLRGIEIGSPYRYKELFYDILSNDYDYVLGSIHTVRGQSVALRELNNGDADNMLYYEEMLKLSEVAELDAIAHFDYVRRGTGSDFFDKDMLKGIFSNMVKNDIALEYNTSGSRRIAGGEPFPTKEKLDIYRQIGGEKITIGSDSHLLTDIGYNFEQAELTIASVGGLKLGYFLQRKFTE